MRPFTREEIGALVPRKEQKSFHMPPDFADLDWGELEFLGWVHRSGHKAYLLTGEPRLYIFDFDQPSNSNKSAAMCSICCTVHERGKTRLFMANLSTRKNVRRGFYACANLNCSANIRTPHPSGMRESITLDGRIDRLKRNLKTTLEVFDR